MLHKPPPNQPESLVQLQGQEANHSGNFLEEFIEREFGRRRVLIEDHQNMRHGTKDFIHPRRLIKRYPYKSIFGCNSRSEFLYIDERSDLMVRIECRWQEKAGSTDEKFCYLIENAKSHMPEKNIWLVIDGDGARGKAVAWIINAARKASVGGKLIRVMTLLETKKAIKELVGHNRP